MLMHPVDICFSLFVVFIASAAFFSLFLSGAYINISEFSHLHV